MNTRTKTSLLAGILLAGLFLVGCGTFGASPTPPTALEAKIYHIETNWVEKVVTKTNEVPQLVPVTQVVTVTNAEHVVTTNTITLMQTNTVQNVVTVTNEVAQYQMTPGATAQGGATFLGSLANTFFPGAGPAVTYGILGLLGLWGAARSTKNGQTAATIAQEVETLRSFIQTLPNGTAYDTAIVGWLQSHQVEAGVADQVLGLLNNKVSNPDAQAAVTEIKAALDAIAGQQPASTASPAPAAPTKTS